VAISRLALPERAHLGRLTASIGIASYPEHGDHLDELLAAADRAMYAAKHGGRNRVVRAPAPAERSRVTPARPRPGRQLRVDVVAPRRAG
jgi:predicted signal transduction protein with EAL and GGDEF domain